MKLLLAFCVLSSSFADEGVKDYDLSVPKGQYETKFSKFEDVPSMDKTNRRINVWSPDPAKYAGQKFPLISYAHGMFGGGLENRPAYAGLLKRLAAFGYVVVMPETCNIGCSDLASLPHDPPGFKNFYTYQLKAIEWAMNMSATGSPGWEILDTDAGVGVAGHSMGGQATVYSSSAAGAGYNIKTAVMHHAYTHSFPAPEVPFLAFTGAKDTTAPPSMTHSFYEVEGANPVKGLVNKADADHHEPDITSFNPLLAPFTAAWFKIFLDETPQQGGIDFHDMIFGTGNSSLCHGGDGDMIECEVHDSSAVIV